MTNYYIKGTSIVEMLSGPNSSGTTTNYGNMGSYTSAISDYRRFDYSAYKTNGSNALSIYEPFNYTYTTPGGYLSMIPVWCNKIRVLAIGGGGSGNMSVPVGGGNYRYRVGQGGGMFLYDITGNTLPEASLTIYCGSGGTYSNTPEQNTHGTPSYITIGTYAESITLYANGGRKGNVNYTVGTNANGGVVIPTTSTNFTLSAYTTSCNGELPIYADGGYSDKVGGRSGLTFGYANNYFTTSVIDNITTPFVPGQGGYSTVTNNDTKRNGSNGFISIHFLPY